MARKRMPRRRHDKRPPVRRPGLRVLTAVVAVLTLLGVYAAFRVTRPAPEEHAHPPAPHGGELVAVGEGEGHPHAEVVREPGGRVTLYLLREDGSQVLQTASRTPAAMMTAGGDREAVLLMPRPWAGDLDGMTSRFGFTLPAGMRGLAVSVSVPALDVGGRALPVEFMLGPSSEPDGEADVTGTPAGLYTAADIAANGGPAAEKFRDHRPAHDARPRPGDRVCPVSRLKADPASAWVVGGRSYAFCCPPCIEEFVRLARIKPRAVRPPEEYRKF